MRLNNVPSSQIRIVRHVDGRITGEAFVRFNTDDDVTAALSRHKVCFEWKMCQTVSFLVRKNRLGARYIELFRSSREELIAAESRAAAQLPVSRHEREAGGAGGPGGHFHPYGRGGGDRGPPGGARDYGRGDFGRPGDRGPPPRDYGRGDYGRGDRDYGRGDYGRDRGDYGRGGDYGRDYGRDYPPSRDYGRDVGYRYGSFCCILQTDFFAFALCLPCLRLLIQTSERVETEVV